MFTFGSVMGTLSFHGAPGLSLLRSCLVAVFPATVIAQDTAPPAAMIMQFLPFVAIGVMFYFMFIRPDRRRQAAQAEMIKNLKKNDRVVTAGGIHGIIINASGSDNVVTLKVDEESGTRIRVNRTSISRLLEETDSESTSA